MASGDLRICLSRRWGDRCMPVTGALFEHLRNDARFAMWWLVPLTGPGWLVRRQGLEPESHE